MNDRQMLRLLRSLTLEEKAGLCSGIDAWVTKANRRRGIPPLRMADGPHGVRKEDIKNRKANGGHSVKATCFPPEVALASSWSPALTFQVGQAIAQECLHFKVGLLLGPGVNIKRSPLNGRNFEYYSEDPLLCGELAAGFIRGVQSMKVGTSLKHFAVNNQETNRMSISAAVDDRALFDLYLKPFEIAVKKASPATVMASYNRINGVFATENKRLLQEILRNSFGFKGTVLSDWGAVNDRPAGIEAGMDLEMPASGGLGDYAIIQAVKNKQISQKQLDAACWNILKLVFRYSRHGKNSTACDFEEHHQLAADALTKGAVLLKNDGILPLSRHQNIAVIGEMAKKPRFQGGGSSIINPKNLVGFLEALDEQDIPYTYAPGYQNVDTSPSLLAQATHTAAEADLAVVFLGLPDQYECEGYDRRYLRLPQSQLQLLHSLASTGTPLCVVLCCGSAIEIPWLEQTNALLLLHLGGEALGEAAVRLLFGQDNPSGKLTESWPLSLFDTPSASYFPMGPTEVTYNESIFVGYRYYDTAKKQVLFPFGYGLSYTQFTYSSLQVEPSSLKAGQPLTVTFSVQNTGQVYGEEIAQLYISRKNSASFQPAHELKGFGRIKLAPGQKKRVRLQVPYEHLAYYDTASRSSVVEAGRYEVQVGASSRDLPLRAEIAVAGKKVIPLDAYSSKSSYGSISSNSFPEADFLALLGRPLEGNRLPKQGEYTGITPLGAMEDSTAGRILLALSVRLSQIFINFSTDPEANRMVARQMARDLPFKNIKMNAGGLIPPNAADALLALCNGQGGLLRFLTQLLAPQPYRRLNKKNSKR